MPNRRQLAREQLEYYLTYLILAYRRWIFIVGLLLLIYGIAVMFGDLPRSFATLIPAAYLLLLSNSYNVTVYTARLGAWIGILWRSDN